MTTTGSADPNLNKGYENGNSAARDQATTNGNNVNGQMSSQQHARYDYGGNPLAHMNTGQSARFPAFGGEFQPGLYRPTTGRKFPIQLHSVSRLSLSRPSSCLSSTSKPVACLNLISLSHLRLDTAGSFNCLLACGMCPSPTQVSKSPNADFDLKGDGCREHLWSHRSLFLRWFLNLHRYCLDPRWIPDHGGIQDGGPKLRLGLRLLPLRLVHLHHPSPNLYSSINRRLPPPVLLPRHCFPPFGYRIRQWTELLHHSSQGCQGWWIFRSVCCFHGLVQRPGWYC